MYTQNSHSLDTLTTFFLSLCLLNISVVFSFLVSPHAIHNKEEVYSPSMKERNNNKTPSTPGQTNRTLRLRPSTDRGHTVQLKRTDTRERYVKGEKLLASNIDINPLITLPQKSQLMMICKGILMVTNRVYIPYRIIPDNVTQSATKWVSSLVHRNVIGSSIHPHSRASECNFYTLSISLECK